MRRQAQLYPLVNRSPVWETGKIHHRERARHFNSHATFCPAEKVLFAISGRRSKKFSFFALGSKQLELASFTNRERAPAGSNRRGSREPRGTLGRKLARSDAGNRFFGAKAVVS